MISIMNYSYAKQTILLKSRLLKLLEHASRLGEMRRGCRILVGLMIEITSEIYEQIETWDRN
jgi:hypothetical protein